MNHEWNQGQGAAAESVESVTRTFADMGRDYAKQAQAQALQQLYSGASPPRILTETPMGKRYVDRRPSLTSFIEDHEIDEAIQVVHDAWLDASNGKPLTFRVAGPKLLVKIHVRPEELRVFTDPKTGEVSKLYLPDTVRAEDKFHSCTGLVIDIGSAAYTGTLRDGSQRFPDGPMCRRGDWVSFDRYAGKRTTVNGVACMIIYDEGIDGTVIDPTDIESGHSEHRI